MSGTEWRVAVGTEETRAVYEPPSSGAESAVFVCAHGAGGSMSDRSTLAAANAAEALGHVKAGAQFDLLFTDVIMPGGMNGRELAEEIERLRPGTSVLFTSGYTEDAIVHHGRLDPGVALLNKPYRKKDLAEKLRQAIDAAA